MVLHLSSIRTSKNFSEIGNIRCLYLPIDSTGREIWLSRLHCVQVAGTTAFYPSVTVHSGIDNKFYSPIREKTMSLQALSEADNISFNIINKAVRRHQNPVFFFIYNTENYYHFIYDTLPYLISFFELKKNIPTLQLLMNYPNSQSTKFYKFVIEFLELLGISGDEIVLVNNETIYESVYFSSSYSHDFNSNLRPREEVYSFLKNLVKKNLNKLNIETSRLIYVSRRTWLHGDYSNIGTNYTNRRKMENENELVNYLAGFGFEEIFTERLSTIEKLAYFNNAHFIIGAIGGGVCNVLFSPAETQLLCIASPTFLDLNSRFSYSLERVRLHWFKDTEHVEPGRIKRFMRVSCDSLGIVGEVTEIQGDHITVSYAQERVAGWNAQNSYKSLKIHVQDCTPLDAGLNSEWRINMNSFISNFKNIF